MSDTITIPAALAQSLSLAKIDGDLLPSLLAELRMVIANQPDAPAFDLVSRPRRQCTLGEYCLATKYADGEAWDQYAVGFYAGEIFPGRHQVLDNDGNPFRANGFRRCEPITREQGDFILHTPGISDTGFKLWDYIHPPEQRLGGSPAIDGSPT